MLAGVRNSRAARRREMQLLGTTWSLVRLPPEPRLPTQISREALFLTECLGIGSPDAVSRILDIMKGLTRHRRTGPHPNDRTAETLPWLAAAARTGIAVVLVACGTAHAQDSQPAMHCPHPAPIENQFNPAAPNLIVMIQKDADLLNVSARIASTYAVHPWVLRLIHGLLLTHISEDLIERLRCEPDIEGLSYDVPMSIN
jgi:hypothetical protein